MTLLTDRASVAVERESRELLLVWQNPATHRFSTVGLLSISSRGFRFRYADEAKVDPDFFALAEFPHLDGEYASPALPAFFANRVMSAARNSYDDYLGWLALDAQSPDLPVEILVRTGAERATDTFHVVEKPSRGALSFVSRFFVSGVRHQPAQPVALGAVSTGDRLELEPEAGNSANADAHRVVTLGGVPVGWVPDWLCGEIAELSRSGWRFEVVAEKVSPEAPSHIQVLCRVTAHLNA